MKEKQEYNIGLDIGTNSVGWSVTDLNNNLLKKGTKNMWGARLFDEGNTAEIRRNFRANRRRQNRRKERVKLLQELLFEDIEKIDSNFYLKLKESFLLPEDRKIKDIKEDEKFNLFRELDMNDSHYYNKYPTIYHLRKELIESKEKQDIRLIYLALHHILKYRGNFLYEGQEFSSQLSKVEENIEIILNYLQEYNVECITSKDKIVDILKNKTLKKKEKVEKLLEMFSYDSENKSIIKNILSSIIGYKFSLINVFKLEESEKDKLSFKDEIDEVEIESILGDNYNIYESLHFVYSWVILQEILQGEDYISNAFVRKYNKYGKDLKVLKSIYKKLGTKEYNQMFKPNEKECKNYQAYNEKESLCSIDELYKEIKNKLDKIQNKDDDIQDVLNEIENNTFLLKINTTDNGAIPYQLHLKELEKILDNQSKYYTSINKNKDKIISIMKFRIPYYVGPLNNKSNFAWLERKNNQKIYPWNFNEVVDRDISAENFIRKMTNTCTYLYNEPVIPKNSLLYSEYCILNELNNIRVNDYHLDKNTKESIVNNLFKKHKKVTINMFKEYLINNQYYRNIEKISGNQNDKEFMTKMNSFVDMEKIFGKIDNSNYDKIEKIIEWITLFEDKDILKRKIEISFSDISKDQMRSILKLRYTGWSRLSRKLLNEIKSYDFETIIDKLRNTNYNFMQIINKKEFGFDKKIEEQMPKIKKDELSYDDVKEIPGSPALKKAIWQTILIVQEIVKIIGFEPKNIYIEFARGEELNKKRKDTRIARLIKLYENIESDLDNFKKYDPRIYAELKNKSKEKELSEKIYLYFIQNGRCLYSGKSLNIDDLSSECEVDHILPQSYIKDDSISNKALVLKQENQKKKDSLLLTDEIIKNNREWWNQLYKNGLIDAKKLHNLTRTSISQDDEIKFINRQLVETRQITKYVTNLLVKNYSNTSVFSINSSFTSNFRKKYEIYKNRNVNDFHHAQDAYIVSIAGNFVDKHFKNLKNEYVYTEYLKNYHKENEETRKRNEYGLVLHIFDEKYKEENNLEKIKKILDYKDCFVSRKLEEQTGEFYGQTIIGKVKAPKIKLKNNLDTLKYGGYTGEQKAYYSIIKYNLKGKEEFELIGVPIQIAYLIKNKQILLIDFLTASGYENCKIIKDKILKYQSYLNENNEEMMLVSDSEIKMNKQLIVNKKYQRLIYIMNKEKYSEEVENEFINIFDYLISKMENEYKTLSNYLIKIKEKRDTFIKIDYENKKKSINGIIDLMSNGQGNLKSIDLTDRLGRMSKIILKKDKLEKMQFINKSVTGMYEKKNKYIN